MTSELSTAAAYREERRPSHDLGTIGNEAAFSHDLEAFSQTAAALIRKAAASDDLGTQRQSAGPGKKNGGPA